MKVILASKSPRRKELLDNIGIKYTCMVSDEEEIIKGDNPEENVKALSLQKAESVAEGCNEDNVIIIGADTVVALDRKILGKPGNEKQAYDMLKFLEGKWHSVWTGVTLIIVENGKKSIETFAQETRVHMYDISDEEIWNYINTKEPLDKAGSYAIQGIGTKFIEEIRGDYNNVVGLPVSKVYQKIKKYIEK